MESESSFKIIYDRFEPDTHFLIIQTFTGNVMSKHYTFEEALSELADYGCGPITLAYI